MNKKRTEDKKIKKLFNLKTHFKYGYYIPVFIRLMGQKDDKIYLYFMISPMNFKSIKPPLLFCSIYLNPPKGDNEARYK